jgi:ribonuclease HII
MLVYAGIDEAGYGPLLGPLCVGLCAFGIEAYDPGCGAPDLWKLLSRAVCRGRRDRRRRIAVEDSKKLKGANSAKAHPLATLERSVLCFLGTLASRAPSGPCPASDDEFLERVLAETSPAPWYRSSTALPIAHDAEALGIATSRLARAAAESGVSCEIMRCEVIDAGDFNQMVARTGNKAAVNLAAVLRLLEHVWLRWPHAHPRVIIDRQGGRQHYLGDLQRAWPDAHIRIVAESESLSRYRLERQGGPLTVSFLTEAESRHLPVALASMLAKYVRELFMVRLNRFFQGHLPELKPTAGYYADAHRYLADIDPVLRRLDLHRPALVRRV